MIKSLPRTAGRSSSWRRAPRSPTISSCTCAARPRTQVTSAWPSPGRKTC